MSVGDEGRKRPKFLGPAWPRLNMGYKCLHSDVCNHRHYVPGGLQVVYKSTLINVGVFAAAAATKWSTPATWYLGIGSGSFLIGPFPVGQPCLPLQQQQAIFFPALRVQNYLPGTLATPNGRY